jgi:flavin-dependent dehydrogenase
MAKTDTLDALVVGAGWAGLGVSYYLNQAGLRYLNQFGDLERRLLRAGHVHSAEEWQRVLERARHGQRSPAWRGLGQAARRR